MKPFIHAKNSSRKFGGQPEDYIDIHNFFDWSKSTLADGRHRAILHNSLGIFISERLFGYPHHKIALYAERFGWTEEEVKAIRELIDLARSSGTTSILNSDGKLVQTRDLGEQHCVEDLGCIPTVADCLHLLPVTGWLRKEEIFINKD